MGIQMIEMIVVITEVMVSVVIEAMIEEITVVEVVLIAIAEMEEVLIAIAEMEGVMIAIAEMEAVMIVIVEMVAVMVMIAEMVAEADITVIEDLQNVMVMIPQRRDQGYNCKNALLPWNPHPHLPVLLFLVAQNQLTPRKKNEKLKKNCKNNKKT